MNVYNSRWLHVMYSMYYVLQVQDHGYVKSVPVYTRVHVCVLEKR